MSIKQNRRVTIRLTPFQAKTLWQLRTDGRDRGDERTSTEVLIAGITRLASIHQPAAPVLSSKSVGQRTEAIEQRVRALEAQVPQLKALIEELEASNSQLKEQLAESEHQRGLLAKELAESVRQRDQLEACWREAAGSQSGSAPEPAAAGFGGKAEVEFDVEVDGRVIAESTAVPGAMAYGATKEEAQAKVEEIVAEAGAQEI
jgi:hypothetical protein